MGNKVLVEYLKSKKSLEEIKSVVDTMSKKDLEKEYDGFRPIFHAVINSTPDVVMYLINKGLDYETPCENGVVFLYCLISNDSMPFEIFEMLIRRKVNYKIKDQHKQSAIHYVAMRKEIEFIKFLCEYDENINLEEESFLGVRPLHSAIGYGNIEVAKFLINKGVNLESKNRYNNKPIHLALLHNLTDIVNILIDSGVNLEAKNFKKWRPIHYAVRYSTLGIVIRLAEAGVNLESELFYTKIRPIHVAIVSGEDRLDIVKYLINKGVNLEKEIDILSNLKTIENINLYHDFEPGVSRKIPPYGVKYQKMNCLKLAIKYSSTEIIKLLIEAQVPISGNIDEYLPEKPLDKEILRLLFLNYDIEIKKKNP